MNKRDLAQQAATGNGEFRTKAVRAGHHRTGEGEHAEAMFMTSSFCFSDAESAKAAFVDDSGDNVYSRFDNPTVQAFEERLAALEARRSLCGNRKRYGRDLGAGYGAFTGRRSGGLLAGGVWVNTEFMDQIFWQVWRRNRNR